MSVDITITQKRIIKKELPLEVILGDSLECGSYDDMWRLDRYNGGSEVIIFSPDSIARGISVVRDRKAVGRVTLRMLSPTAPEEIDTLFDTVSRMIEYWGRCAVDIDGERIKPKELDAARRRAVEFNRKVLSDMTRKMLDGESESLTVPAAKWPLVLGAAEAERIGGDACRFSEWLHRQQSGNIYYSSPVMYQRAINGEICGALRVIEGRPTVLPNMPSVPLSMQKKLEGVPVRYIVDFYSDKTYEGIFGHLLYDEFLKRVGEDAFEYYDCEHRLLRALTLSEMHAILGGASLGEE